jgi:hypothetical protein
VYLFTFPAECKIYFYHPQDICIETLRPHLLFHFTTTCSKAFFEAVPFPTREDRDGAIYISFLLHYLHNQLKTPLELSSVFIPTEKSLNKFTSLFWNVIWTSSQMGLEYFWGINTSSKRECIVSPDNDMAASVERTRQELMQQLREELHAEKQLLLKELDQLRLDAVMRREQEAGEAKSAQEKLDKEKQLLLKELNKLQMDAEHGINIQPEREAQEDKATQEELLQLKALKEKREQMQQAIIRNTTDNQVYEKIFRAPVKDLFQNPPFIWIG